MNDTDQPIAGPSAEPTSRPAPRLLRSLVPLLLAAATTVGYLVLRPAPAPPSTNTPSFAPASPTAVALLGELEPGTPIASFIVDGVEGPGVEGQGAEAILVHLHRDELRMAITIAPRGSL